MRASLIAVLAVVTASLASTPRAWAEPSPESAAAAAMDRANDELQRREYESAIKHFGDARALVPKASGPYLGLGLAYAATDRCDKAVEALDEYLRRRSRDPKPAARAALDSCRARLATPSILRVETSPPGAEVRLDDAEGLPLGTTPFETSSIARGPHRVHLRREGYKSHTADVRVEPGARSLVTATLEALAGSVVIVNGLNAPPSSTTPPRPPAAPSAPPPVTSGIEHPQAQGLAAAPPAVAPLPAAGPVDAAPIGTAPVTLPTTGHLLVVSSVQPATVFINGERLSSDGRAEVTLPPGLYGVAVAREGYRGASGSIALLAGDHKTLSAPLKRVKNRGGAAVGVLFTLLAAGGEGVAIAGHVLADRSVVGTPDYDKYHQMELYGQIGAGCAAGVALVSFLLDIITNRGRVDEGPAYDLVPAATGAAP